MTTGLPGSAEVRHLAARLVTDELVVLPVRHHSPACAESVREAFTTHRPSAVLVEGPRSFTPMVDLLADEEAVYPLAVYAYARRPPRAGEPVRGQGAYYPFCDFSPELVAVRSAVEAGVPAEFIDLELAEQAALAERATLDDPSAVQGRSLLEERRLGHSQSLRRLATRLGCRDEEDLWELLFEADPAVGGLAEHTARMTAYCLLARHDHDDRDLLRDGTHAREAEMAWHVRQALERREAGAGPVLVVVGGFHAVALPDLLAAPPPRPVVDVGEVESGHALIRYGFDRLERLNGYAAGMTSPGWHQRIWDERSRGADHRSARQAAGLGTLLDIAERMRGRHRTLVPTPSLAAAHQQQLLLADLRDRPGPLRSDLLDGVTSCLVQGDADTEGSLVQRVAREVLTGHRVGRVPASAGTPPLVADTLARLRAQRIDADAGARTVALDLYRKPSHRRTSRLLHGLALLAVPFAERVAGPDFVAGSGLERLQERWSCLWTPDTDAALVEASLHGSTLPEAVATAYAAQLAAATEGGAVPGSAHATRLLAQALVLGLHDQAGSVMSLVGRALGREPSFPAVVGATGTLALLAEGREPLEAHGLSGLGALVAAGYSRALYLATDLGGDDETALTGALARLRELLASPAGAGLDPDPFWAAVARLRTDHPGPVVRGAAAGLAFVAGRLDAEQLERDVRGHLSGTVEGTDAVGFLLGLLATAREATWQDVGVVPALDARLADWQEDAFLAHLPALRLAFSGLTPRETDRVAELVGRIHGGAALGGLVTRDLDEAALSHHLDVSARAAALLRRDGLGAWVEAP